MSNIQAKILPILTLISRRFCNIADRVKIHEIKFRKKFLPLVLEAFPLTISSVNILSDYPVFGKSNTIITKLSS